MSGTNSLGTNGGLDPSIPLQAGRGVQQPNALQQLGEFANAQNALNQAKLFPLIQQQQQLAVKQRALEYATTAYQGIQARSAAHLGDPGDINPKHVMTDVMDWAQHQNEAFPDHPPIPMSMVVGILKGLPMPEGNAPDAWHDSGYQQKLRAAIKLQYANTLEPMQRLQELTGTPSSINTGPAVQPGLTAGRLGGNPGGSFTPAGEPVQQYLSRPEQATQQPGVGPQGEPTATPLGTRLRQQGRGDLLGPTASGAPNLSIQGLPPSLRNPAAAPPQAPQEAAAPPSASIPAPQAPVAPAPAQMPPVPAPPTGAVATGLPPGANTALEGSAGHYATLSAGADSFQQRVFPLTQALGVLRSAKSADTGPGSETVNHIRSFLLAQTPASLQQFLPGIGVDAIKVANYDQVAKYLAQYAGNQPGAGGTDLRLLSSQLSQPNTHISKPAALELIQKTIGMERMQQAALLNFNKDAAGGPRNAQGFDQYMAHFATNADPVAYAWDLLTPAERKSHFDSLDTRGKHNYLASVRAAQESGVTRPTQ